MFEIRGILGWGAPTQRGGVPTTQNRLFWPIEQHTRQKFSGAKLQKIFEKRRQRRRFRKFSRFFGILLLRNAIKSEFWGVLGVKFSKFFRNFNVVLKTAFVVFYGRFHQNSSKSFHLRPFWSVKHWFFEKIFGNFSNFWQNFRKKLGPIEQHKPQISENSFLKNE